jgi:hypothetical protein
MPIIISTPKLSPPDFITHWNYLRCLNHYAATLAIGCNLQITQPITKDAAVDKKVRLIHLTVESLHGEKAVIDTNVDFAELCVPWISVKSYYILFNQLLILEYLITANSGALSASHKQVLQNFKRHLRTGDLAFNVPEFNVLHACNTIAKLKLPSGANVRIRSADFKELHDFLLKKLVAYKLDNYKRDNKIKNFRTKGARRQKTDFLNANDVTLSEFFYWYRIKANYRDMEFVDTAIEDDQFADYYKDYYNITMTFYGCLKDLINDLSRIRFGQAML